jgi:hypothetical protein
MKTEDEPKKIRLGDWYKYQNATGYDVEITVTYTRTRKIRAETPTQARKFAVERETQTIENSYKNKNHIGYVLKKIKAGGVTLVKDRV